jgi:hypothetical protein
VTDGTYVLAVCGGREHLERAGAAAARLAERSRRRIVLVTDPARNRAPLPAVETIALPTDPALTDAQAAFLL